MHQKNTSEPRYTEIITHLTNVVNELHHSNKWGTLAGDPGTVEAVVDYLRLETLYQEGTLLSRFLHKGERPAWADPASRYPHVALLIAENFPALLAKSNESLGNLYNGDSALEVAQAWRLIHQTRKVPQLLRDMYPPAVVRRVLATVYQKRPQVAAAYMRELYPPSERIRTSNAAHSGEGLEATMHQAA